MALKSPNTCAVLIMINMRKLLYTVIFEDIWKRMTQIRMFGIQEDNKTSRSSKGKESRLRGNKLQCNNQVGEWIYYM